ncbi:MAG: radical SAM protein [Lentisphaeraceae bacterium]|nr:radical SAM protein [Lentisphaeraceae bacterium]
MDIDSPEAFQSWLDELMSKGHLKRDVFKKICHILKLNKKNTSWYSKFDWFHLMPTYLNLQFVEGSCNANCRMCSAGKGIPLSWMTAEQVASILDHAPTVSSVTLSSGNSEPTLNPEMINILDLFAKRHITVDFYSNALSLSKELSDSILETETVNVINFSLDAATHKTYAKIRRSNFAQVLENINYLVERKKVLGKEYPNISVSMVEMHDNIQELPELVDYAASIGAFRVYVESLLHEDELLRGLKNQSALQNPNYKEFISEAQERALKHGIHLQLPPKLRISSISTKNTIDAPKQSEISTKPINTDGSRNLNSSPTPLNQNLPKKCGWINGLWVNINGSMGLCCVNQEPKLGNIYDAPLRENKAYLEIKQLLDQGKVFPSCMKVLNTCGYLSENKEAGVDVKKWIVTEKV